MSQCEAYCPGPDGMRCALQEGHPGVHRDEGGEEFDDGEAEY